MKNFKAFLKEVNPYAAGSVVMVVLTLCMMAVLLWDGAVPEEKAEAGDEVIIVLQEPETKPAEEREIQEAAEENETLEAAETDETLETAEADEVESEMPVIEAADKDTGMVAEQTKVSGKAEIVHSTELLSTEASEPATPEAATPVLEVSEPAAPEEATPVPEVSVPATPEEATPEPEVSEPDTPTPAEPSAEPSTEPSAEPEAPKECSHSWIFQSVYQAPTCSGGGLENQICSKCGATQITAGTPTGQHQYEVEVAGDCCSEEIVVCTECNHREVRGKDLKNHIDVEDGFCYGCGKTIDEEAAQ